MLENLRTFCGVDEPEELLSLTAGDVRAMADAYARFGLGVVPAEVVELAVVELAAFQGSGGGVVVETEGVVSPVTEGASVEKNDLVDRHAADVMGIARGMLAEAKWIDGEYIVPAAGAASFRYTVYTTVGGVVKMLLWYNAPSGTTNTIIRVLPGEWLAAAEHLTRG